MVKYIIKRLLNGLIVLLGVVTITFFITRVVPSDVAGKWAGERATEEQRKQAIAELGLDKPLVTQYVKYLKDLLSGDLGRPCVLRNSLQKSLQAISPQLWSLFWWLSYLRCLWAYQWEFIPQRKTDKCWIISRAFSQ